MIQLPKWLLHSFADIRLDKRPMFFNYKLQQHKVKGAEIRKLLNKLIPGDILLYKHNGYLSGYFTPGFWAHAALYIGDNTIIHAIGEGVVREDILDFCRVDNIACVRVIDASQEKIQTAIDYALLNEAKHTKYDYNFISDNGKVYCTELVHEAYGNLFKDEFTTVLDHNSLLPDGIYNSKKVEKIIEFRHN